MRSHAVNNLNNFIGGWYIEDLSLCDKLIEYHKNSPDKFEGRSGRHIVNKEVKDSTDVRLEEENLKHQYLDLLFSVCGEYVKKYPLCNHYARFGVNLPPNIQHYKPNQGYHAWHCEKCTAEPIIAARHLVYMTYLNDVNDAGETEFYYQQVKIRPRKGLTLIWPSEWTFTHKGISSPTEDKYIVTGWFNFVASNEKEIIKTV